MTRKIFLLAGEASGDALGAKLMRELKESDPNIRFFGVGGAQMEALGMESLFPMNELSLLGFAEIIPHIPHLLRRIEETADYIEEIRPDIVVTIDAPAFNFRVAKKLKSKNSDTTLVHFVAPTVWAYKPKRAEKIAALYDHLLVILPFEPPYFDKVGLPCTFTGHPILEEDLAGGNGESFRQKHGIYKNAPIIYLMPGSRASEVGRLLPVFTDTLKILKETEPNLCAVTLAAEGFKKEIEKCSLNFPVQNIIITKEEKKDAMAASSVALAKSGTGSIELAIAGVPLVVTYKVNPISAWALRRMIKVPYVNIVNLLLEAPIIPELLQEDCNPEYLAASLSVLLNNDDSKRNQLINAQKAVKMLQNQSMESPSKKAADTIMNLCSNSG